MIAIRNEVKTFPPPYLTCMVPGCEVYAPLLCAGAAFCYGHWRRYLVARLADYLFSWDVFLYRRQTRKRGSAEVMLDEWVRWAQRACEEDVVLLLVAYSGVLSSENVVALVDDIDRRYIDEIIHEVL